MDTYQKLEILHLAFEEFQTQSNPWYNGHQERCASMSAKFARRIQKQGDYNQEISEGFFTELSWASKLHDIGKASIPETILNKSGRLSRAEVSLIQLHSTVGMKLIDSVKITERNISLAVLHHHENWNGTGYPDKMREHDIPLLSRIIRIVDCYDAMTNVRAYRIVYSGVQALAEMVKEVGTSFDPNLFSIFSELMKE